MGRFAPWAQPQLSGFVEYHRGYYKFDAQLAFILNEALKDTLNQNLNSSPVTMDLSLSTVEFYLLPTFGLEGTLQRSGAVALEIQSLRWEPNTLQFQDGEVPIRALWGSRIPPSLEFLFPGLNNAQFNFRSRILSSDKEPKFQFWLEEFKLRSLEDTKPENDFENDFGEAPLNNISNISKYLFIQGNIQPEQINLEQFTLHWDSLKMSNRLIWDILAKDGRGLLVLQGQKLNYRLQNIELPIVETAVEETVISQQMEKSAPDIQRIRPSEIQPKRGWLLQGDYGLYAYLDSQRYQLAFEKIYFPQLSKLKLWGITQVQREGLPINNSLLSLDISGNYPNNFKRKGWNIDVSRFRLEIPKGGSYLPEGGELAFAAFLSPNEWNFPQLALREPQRLLEGEGKLNFIEPLAPVLPQAQPGFRFSQPTDWANDFLSAYLPHENSPISLSSEYSAESLGEIETELLSGANDPYGNALRSQAPALPLPRVWSEDKPSVIVNKENGYWLGELNLRGSQTIISTNREEYRITDMESLEVNMRTTKSQFLIQSEGQFDVTRITQLISLQQGEQDKGLEQGLLKFSGTIKGGLNQEPDTESRSINFQEFEGEWNLVNASYAKRELEIGSQVLWHRSPVAEIDRQIQTTKSNVFAGGSWLFSDIQGHLGQMKLERSFISFQSELPSRNYQNLAGLLNYRIRFAPEGYYRSSLTLDLKRNLLDAELKLDSAEKRNYNRSSEFLRWRGNLYSYPLKFYKQTDLSGTAEQNPDTDVVEKLRNEVFSSSREFSREIIREIYPGFTVFVEPRLVSIGQDQDKVSPELYLFRRRLEDLEMGIRKGRFWLNVGEVYPISFRIHGALDGQNLEAQMTDISIRSQLLNELLPRDAIMKSPVLQFIEGRIVGSLRLYGKIFNPAMDGLLKLQDGQLRSVYFPGYSPSINIELISQGHVLIAKPFRLQFPNGAIYSNGYEEAYFRHQTLQITRYYLNFHAEGKTGVPIFYDAYGIVYKANAKGSALLEGNDQLGSLWGNFWLERLVIQASQRQNTLNRTTKTIALNNNRYPFSVDVRAEIGPSSRLAYPQETNPVFHTRLNVGNKLKVFYDGDTQQGHLDGHILLNEGQLYLLGNQIALRKGELIFDEDFDNFSPEINLFFSLYTYDQQGQNLQINLDYQGELANLQKQDWSPTLHSQPSLPEPQLRSLVAAQFGSGGAGAYNNGGGNQLLSGFLSQFGSNVVLKPIEEFIRRTFRLDRVDIQTSLLDNLLNSYLGTDTRLEGISGTVNNWSGRPLDEQLAVSSTLNGLRYLDNTHIALGMYLDRNNTILLSFNIDFLYKPQDTQAVLFSRDGLQIIPGLGLKFHTPLFDITWGIGMAHYNDFFITDSSLLLEWSLTEFLNRKRRFVSFESRQQSLGIAQQTQGQSYDAVIPYSGE